MYQRAARILRYAFAAAAIVHGGAGIAAEGEQLLLEVGKQHRIDTSARLEAVAVGNPDLLSARVTSAHTLLLTPRAVGSTTLVLNLQDGSREAREVIVSRPRMRVQTRSLDDHQALRSDGEATGPVVNPEFAFGHQVQTDVRIVEVSRSRLMSAGVFLGRATRNTTGVISPPGTAEGVSTVTGALNELSQLILPTADSYNLAIGSASKGWQAAISALEANGVAYTLAQPSLVSMSGQTATFMSGGEFPVPVQSREDTITIEYKEFGIRLHLTPTVLDDDRITLKVAPEVSELDFSSGVTAGGVTVPGLTVRRTETTVTLGDGESFVIAGLVSQRHAKHADKLPGLGDLPLIGALFRSSRFEREDQELLMVVTPHIVRPMRAGFQAPDLPGQAIQDYDPNFFEFLVDDDYGAQGGRASRTSIGFSQ